jgi:RimJ/RimL family protein N-acetyltransferase
MTTLFETERLLVRQFTFDDLDEFAQLCADPVVMQFMGDGAVLSRDEVKKWIEVCQQKYRQRGYGTSAVIEKATNRFIGLCGIIRAPGIDFDEIIYSYHQESWGQGYATEAGLAMLHYVFERSQLTEIYATIYENNSASIRMMDKLKMRFVKREIEDNGNTTLYYVTERHLHSSV